MSSHWVQVCVLSPYFNMSIFSNTYTHNTNQILHPQPNFREDFNLESTYSHLHLYKHIHTVHTYIHTYIRMVQAFAMEWGAVRAPRLRSFDKDCTKYSSSAKYSILLAMLRYGILYVCMYVCIYKCTNCLYVEVD